MKLPSIAFSTDSLSRFSEVISKEWLVTNGLGSYASQTVPGLNTRKYHGLLVAALNPPGERTVCLSKLDEDLLVDDDTFRLGSNEFEDIIYPEGYKLIKQFSVTPFPTYLYDLGNVQTGKTVFMPHKKNAVAVLYSMQNRNNKDVRLKIFPLMTCRHFHTVVDRFKVNFTQQSRDKEVEATFKRPQATVIARITDGVFHEKLNWIEHLTYREEGNRGEAHVDDCFQPGYFEVLVPAGSKKSFAVACAAATEAQTAKDTLDSFASNFDQVNQSFADEQNRLSFSLSKFYLDHQGAPMSDWLNWILMAADSFVVQNFVGDKAVIAGYFWFEPWGRDTFISLPGLMLATGRFNDAKDILQNFIQYIKGGLIPNFVTDKTGNPAYNTVDGTLWYVNSVLQYVKYTGDLDFVEKQLWNKLQTIVENHTKGTMFDIHLDDDGLLMHGPRLTWMDAVVDGDMITPRGGKAVEIQALWYNTLKTMELFARHFDEKDLAKKYAAMSNQTNKAFNEKFWNTQMGCLFDVLEPTGGVDASMRPNQIFAVSLDYSMLDADKSRKVVETVNRELVTPYGLRTLSLDDPKFVGRCFGDRRSRDTAYHNGTIWPWLLGPYITAHLKVNDYSTQAKKYALENLVVPLFSVGIHQGGLGTINEIYDCDVPNEPRGCVGQAWSVAEPLRAYIEDILGIRPSSLSGFDLFF